MQRRARRTTAALTEFKPHIQQFIAIRRAFARGSCFVVGDPMANQHASHPASSQPVSGRADLVRFSLTPCVSRARHRLGGMLRWEEADGIDRMLRRGVALGMAVLLSLLPVMQIATAAENARVAANTRVAALSPARLPLEVAAPAFTLVAAGAAAHLAHDGAEVRVPPGALATGSALSIRPLAAREVAKLPPGLLNTTRGPRHGYRMEPSQHFNAQVTVTLPYDRHLLPEGTPDRDVRIFWYDTAAKRWTPLRRVEVNAREQTVTGWTDHFTDFITGVVNVPNHQQVEGYTPTKFSDMKTADPGATVNLIEPPLAHFTGAAGPQRPPAVARHRLRLLARQRLARHRLEPGHTVDRHRHALGRAALRHRPDRPEPRAPRNRDLHAQRRGAGAGRQPRRPAAAPDGSSERGGLYAVAVHDLLAARRRRISEDRAPRRQADQLLVGSHRQGRHPVAVRRLGVQRLAIWRLRFRSGAVRSQQPERQHRALDAARGDRHQRQQHQVLLRHRRACLPGRRHGAGARDLSEPYRLHRPHRRFGRTVSGRLHAHAWPAGSDR